MTVSDSPLIVTLDGPAGVGKTTLAKRVADELGVAYLDTGAMFRATALALGPGASSLPVAEIEARMADMVFRMQGVGAGTVLYLNDRAVGDEIRTEEAGMLASDIATIPAVRAFQKEAQQAIGRGASLVAEGRDMGTVVFPGARHKFFLDADPEERALRRQRQLGEMGKPVPELADLTEQMRRRDEQDRNRAVAPLRPAEDATIVDTTRLDIDGVFHAIMRGIRDKEIR